jgi:hypothetical protein
MYMMTQRGCNYPAVETINLITAREEECVCRTGRVLSATTSAIYAEG